MSLPEVKQGTAQAQGHLVCVLLQQLAQGSAQVGILAFQPLQQGWKGEQPEPPAASSNARGKPSRHRQISAMSWAVSAISSKAGWTSLARGTWRYPIAREGLRVRGRAPISPDRRLAAPASPGYCCLAGRGPARWWEGPGRHPEEGQ